MPEGRVTIGEGSRAKTLPIRLHGAAPTFEIAVDRIEAQALARLDLRLADLLEIAAAVFAADGAEARGALARPGMGADWRRTFVFDLPVRDPGFWSDPDVVEALEEAVAFLTDDQVQFRFHAAADWPAPQEFLPFGGAAADFRAEEVILFSGGLDSFAGTLERLSTRPGRVILVTHRAAQKAITRQVGLGQWFADRFPGRVLHLHIRARRTGSPEQARERTQRSRSFLFAALGQVVARMFGERQVTLYENGIISHNLPIAPR